MKSPYWSLTESDRKIVDKRVNGEVAYLTVQALKRRMTTEQSDRVSAAIKNHERKSRNKHATDLMISREMARRSGKRLALK